MATSAPTTKRLALRLLSTLDRDRDRILLRIDNYLRGVHDDPFMPDNADAEYKLLAERCKTNVIPFLVGTPAQAMYVDQFRRGSSDIDTDDGLSEGRETRENVSTPEWDHWQKSRLDGRQQAIYRAALGYGHAFALTEMIESVGVRTKGLSPLRTTALYEDAANDDNPIAALHVVRWSNVSEEQPGEARMWDREWEYQVKFLSLTDPNGLTVKKLRRHGSNECPVTRFAAAVDLDGRTVGVVEPMIPLQNRINQTVFDLLIVQSFASFKVRTISGMAPPLQMRPLDANGDELTKQQLKDGVEPANWVPRLDDSGRPIPEKVSLNAKRVFWAEDPNVDFGTLDETPLDGFISAIEMGFRHMAALSQTPPHHILGQIANLSAEALTAAETALSRKIQEFQATFGESWERVFRIAAEIGGFEGMDDFHGEVVWRDMEQRSLAQAADALGKLHEQLGIPRRGLWKRVPDVTANELEEWEDLAEQEDGQLQLAQSLRRASTVQPPSFRAPTTPPGSEAA